MKIMRLSVGITIIAVPVVTFLFINSKYEGSTKLAAQYPESTVSLEAANSGEIRLSGKALSATELARLEKNVRTIDGKIDRLEALIGKVSQRLESSAMRPVGKPVGNTAGPFVSTGMDSGKMMPGVSSNWTASLDAETRHVVDETFKRNASRLRDAIESMGSIENINRGQMEEMIERNQEDLESELKAVLSPEDYEQFIKSMPPALPQAAPIHTSSLTR